MAVNIRYVQSTSGSGATLSQGIALNVPASEVTIFTHAASLKDPQGNAGAGAILDNLSFYNSNTTTSRRVKAFAVPSGATLGESHCFLNELIPPLGTLIYRGKRMLSSCVIKANQDVGTDVYGTYDASEQN